MLPSAINGGGLNHCGGSSPRIVCHLRNLLTLKMRGRPRKMQPSLRDKASRFDESCSYNNCSRFRNIGALIHPSPGIMSF